MGEFHVKQGIFPCSYLGMPLKLDRLTRHNEQKLVDKVAGKLPRWKGRLLTKTGQLTLVNSVLSSTIIYHITSSQLSNWAIKRIDKIHRNFLWIGSEDAHGGNCMVSWKRIKRPKSMGGLGILDLTKFNRVLYAGLGTSGIIAISLGQT
jgi:hypothetical protein